jgi:predicted RNase H-like HicB family nuclease
MLEYHAAYYHGDDGWIIAQVLDFPAAISQGKTLRSARRMIRDALRQVAECMTEEGQPLPRPDRSAKDPTAILVEKIPLRVRFTCGVVE